MFDDLTRFLKELEQTKEISVPFKCVPDADGYLEKECPNQDCMFTFKILEQDWIDKVRDEEVFCPFCGHTAPATSWYTTEEIEWAKNAAFKQVTDKFDDAMERDAQNWNRRQPRNSFIKMTLEFKRGTREVLLPLAASEPMRLKIACAECACHYSVIGSAYFCPACGHNAADLVFDQSLDKIVGALDAAPIIRSNLEDRDTAENTVRLLVENGLQQAVTAFQRFAEALWSTLPDAPNARRNVFQNLQEGSALWEAAIGKSYTAYLSAEDMLTLGRYFQQRHVLAHREGLVDADYVSRSGDTSYRVGQRLVIREEAVRNCVTLVRTLGHGLKGDLAGMGSPS